MTSGGRGIPAFQHRDFLVFWLGALVSNTGTWLQGLTVPYVLFQLTGSALWVGGVTVAQYLPMVIMSPLGGSLADHRSRRSVLIVTQSGLAMTATGLWLAWVAGVREPLALLAFVAVGGIFNGLNLPSWQAFVSDLVPKEALLSAVTMNSLQFNAARAVGPGIAGLLIAALGPSWAFGLNALSYLVVIAAILAVHARTRYVRRKPDHGVVRQFSEAIHYAITQPGLVVVLIVSVLVGVLGNPIFSFTVVFAGAVYLVGPVALGFLNVAFGVGAVAAAPVVSGWRREVPLSGLVRWGLLGYGVMMIVFGVAQNYFVGLVALVVIGASFLSVISGVNTSLQMYVDERFRGRVMALRLMLFTLSFAVGGVIQGALADLVGPQLTVVGAGVLLLIAALVMGRLRGRIGLAALDGPG